MGHVGSKTRSLGQILQKLCVRSRSHIFSPILMKLCQTVCLDKNLYDLKMCHVRSKTRSLGQILEKKKKKPSLPSRGHIFNLILMKLDQNVCLDEIPDEFENGSCSVRD